MLKQYVRNFYSFTWISPIPIKSSYEIEKYEKIKDKEIVFVLDTCQKYFDYALNNELFDLFKVITLNGIIGYVPNWPKNHDEGYFIDIIQSKRTRKRKTRIKRQG